MKRTAVLFDMDGLMVDTEPLARLAWERVMKPYEVTMTDALYSLMLGRRTVESAQLVLDEFHLPVPLDVLVARKTGEYLLILEAGVPVMPGLWEILDGVETLGLPWAVATSTPRPVAEIVLGKLNLTGRYGALACGGEVAHGKPAPDIFLLAAERLGVPPNLCLALEDSAAGCVAAAAAGMRVVVVGMTIQLESSEPTRDEAFPCAYRRYSSLVEVAVELSDIIDGE